MSASVETAEAHVQLVSVRKPHCPEISSLAISVTGFNNNTGEIRGFVHMSLL
jgi:hypothetical protein